MKIIEDDIKLILQDRNIFWNNYDNKTFFVTGATGLIGSLVVRTLLSYGHNIKIVALVRDINKAKKMFANDIEYVIADITDSFHYDGNVDYIIHCAAITNSKYMVDNPVETILISFLGTKNMLEFSKRKSLQGFLYISSMEVYGTTELEKNPITENKLGFIDLNNVRSSYSESKRICELLCNCYFNEYEIPIKIARLAQTFGPGISLDDNRVSMQFAKSVLTMSDIVLHSDGKSVSNFCYTTDTIRGIFTILSKGKNGETYNICNDKESRTISEIANLVANEISEGKINVIYDIPKNNSYGYAPNTEMRLSSKKIMNLGWKPQIDMKNAYLKLLDYLKLNNFLK